MMQAVLVTGGAGYIGSHTCKYLYRNGYLPVVVDNLVRGHREAVRWGPFIAGSIGDRKFLKRVFSEFNFIAVMHFASYSYVGESIQRPDVYYRNNVAHTLNLLDAVVASNVKKFIFSSSCATYGEPPAMPITEESPQVPISPYGKTKLMVEGVLKDYHNSFGINYVILRYFNAAGADPGGDIGEDHRPETHLLPILLQSILNPHRVVYVYGADYPTKDGTCIRDYIHVEDIARAHLLALESLLGECKSAVFNLGNGAGFSVQELVEVVKNVTRKAVTYKVRERRGGDPAVLFSECSKIKRELGWTPKFADLNEIVSTAWRWHKHHPNGY